MGKILENSNKEKNKRAKNKDRFGINFSDLFYLKSNLSATIFRKPRQCCCRKKRHTRMSGLVPSRQYIQTKVIQFNPNNEIETL